MGDGRWEMGDGRPHLTMIKEQFNQNGVVILKGHLSQARMTRLDEAKRQLDHEHAISGDAIRNARFYMGPWPAAIDDLEHWPEIVALVRELIGDSIALYYRRFLIKDARFKGSVAAHQDLPYWHGGLEKIHLFIPVSPNTVQNGYLRFYAGSHRYGLIGQGDIEAERFSGIQEVYDDLYPGDVVIMDNRTWHYSKPAEVDEPRYLIQLMYQPSSDGSYVGKPTPISGQWQTDLRFHENDALIYANVNKYIKENADLKEKVAALEAQIADGSKA